MYSQNIVPHIGFVEDVGNPVSFAEDTVILVELVGNIELIIREQLGERLIGRHQRDRHVHVVGATVRITGIVIAAVGGEGGFIARDHQAGFADGAIDLS